MLQLFAAKNRAIKLKRLQTICGQVVPVRPVKPVPAIQVRRTCIRAIPEITAALSVPI
nr:hypothetical protein [uncultured Lachnoclostridium sp.]